MGRGPSHIGRAQAHLKVLPGGVSSGLDDLEDERTTIEPEPPEPGDEAPTPIAASSSTDELWEDGTTVAEEGDKRVSADEPTVEDQARPLPPLQLVQGTATGAADPRSLAKLQVVSGSDQGRVFDLRPGKELSVGRAVDNDVCLTDIAVSRRHLELSWDGDAWVLRDRGSGNGTLINERIEDGRCQLRDGDRIEIGNTVFRFDHPPSATKPTVTSWNQDDDEAATVAGKPGRSPSSPPVAEPQRPRTTSATLPPSGDRRQPPPPGPARAKRASQTPEARPGTVRGMPVAEPRRDAGSAAQAITAPPVAAPQFLASGAVGSAAAPSIAPMFGEGARPATTTALVEPRLYPAAAYPFIVAPDNRRKHIVIGASVAALLALIGIGAMIGGDEPTKTTPSPAMVVGREPAGVADTGGGAPRPPPAPAVVDPPAPAVVPPIKKKPVTPVTPVTRPPRPKAPPRIAVRIEPPPDKKPPAPKGMAGVEKKADGLYRSKDWKGAAALLRDTAAGASETDAKRLRAMAADYDTIGTNLSTGATLAKAKPTDALGALKKALAADRRAGGAHQQAIRDNLAKIAPSAAAAYMAKQNYPMARLAADDAVNVGAGSNATVANVRTSLERKAGEFFVNAQKLLKDKPEEAKPLLRNIIKIVPADSPWYGKAYKLLNQRKAAAADEDE